MADGGVYARAGGKWERVGSGGANGGLDVDATRDDAVLQVKDTDGVKSWVEGMALQVADAVPDDTAGEIGDVVFIPGGPGGLPIGGGKILQVERGTDDRDRTTASTSPVDANLSVTITPNKSDSSVLLLAIVRAEAARSGAGVIAGRTTVLITDSSGNPISGAEESRIGIDQIIGTNPTVFGMHTVVGWSTPATTSATTYKVQWYVSGAQSGTLSNASHTAQLFAIEVAA